MIAESLLPLAVPVAEIVPLAQNPRQGNVEAVARSLARFGQQKPIVGRYRPDGKVEVLAGNHTFAAALSLGWDLIAVAVGEWSDDEAAAFAVADNRTSDLAGWDYEVLTDLLSGLDSDLLAATGFTAEDLEALSFKPGDLPADLPADPPDARDPVRSWRVVWGDEGQQREWEEFLARWRQDGEADAALLARVARDFRPPRKR